MCKRIEYMGQCFDMQTHLCIYHMDRKKGVVGLHQLRMYILTLGLYHVSRCTCLGVHYLES